MSLRTIRIAPQESTKLRSAIRDINANFAEIDCAASGRYQHTQDSPASSWVVNHNRGARPIVQTYSLGGAEILGQVLHIDDNTAHVYFDNPIAGLAICV